jgi:hypothetical protein
MFLAVFFERSMRPVALQTSFSSNIQQSLKVIAIPTDRSSDRINASSVCFNRITPFSEQEIFGWAGGKRQIGLSPES